MSSVTTADTAGIDGRSRIAAALAKRMRGRRRAEVRFQVYGIAAIVLSVTMLAILLVTIIQAGYTAFIQAYFEIDVTIDEQAVDPDGARDPDDLAMVNYAQIVESALVQLLDLEDQQVPLNTLLALPRARAENLIEELDAQIASGRITFAGITDFGQPVALGLLANLNTMPPVEDFLSDDLRGRVDLAAVIGLAGELRGALADVPIEFANLQRGRFVDADLLEPFADRVIPESVTDPRERTGLLRGVARAVNDSVAESVRLRFAEQSLSLGDLENADLADRLRSTLSEYVDEMISRGAGNQLRAMVLADPELIGQTISLDFLASSDVDVMMKGQISRDLPESRRQVNDLQLQWMDRLQEEGYLGTRFAWSLFTNGASTQPEQSGIGVAVVGSFYMMLIVLALALPLGVATAIYLEEFAPKNRATDVIEVNINNLAAVPSIVFGLLGLAVFVNFANLGRSAPLVGGLVLTLMTLPTIIIAARAALKAVPPSIREAALGVGASKTQSIFHHVLPLAMPGILTGTIIGMAQALGETAPLLMIGMVAFVTDYPATPMDPATALPVQIFMWATLPERGFVERTSAGIMVLLAFLVFMNAMAIWLRKKFERRW